MDESPFGEAPEETAAVITALQQERNDDFPRAVCMKRKDVLWAIRVAGYHCEKDKGVLLYVKNWVSLQAYLRAFRGGAAMRQNGVP